MTTISGRSALGAETAGLPTIRSSRGAHPIGLLAPGVTRLALDELPVAASLHPGRRPPCPVAPYREDPCPLMPVHARLARLTRLATSGHRQLSAPCPCPGPRLASPRLAARTSSSSP
jgi:hypothetical protein